MILEVLLNFAIFDLKPKWTSIKEISITWAYSKAEKIILLYV